MIVTRYVQSAEGSKPAILCFRAEAFGDRDLLREAAGPELPLRIHHGLPSARAQSGNQLVLSDHCLLDGSCGVWRFQKEQPTSKDDVSVARAVDALVLRSSRTIRGAEFLQPFKTAPLSACVGGD